MSIERMSLYESVGLPHHDFRTPIPARPSMIGAFARRIAAKYWQRLEERLAGESDTAIAEIVTGRRRRESDRLRERALIDYRIGFVAA